MFCIQVDNAVKSSSSCKQITNNQDTEMNVATVGENETQVGEPVSGVEWFSCPGEQSCTGKRTLASVSMYITHIEHIEFTAGNPLLETITGELHLYRSVEKGIYQMSPVLCVLAVPAYFTAAVSDMNMA